MWILHFVYTGHEFITGNLVPRAFSSTIFKWRIVYQSFFTSHIVFPIFLICNI